MSPVTEDLDRYRLDRHLGPDDIALELADDVARGLTAPFKELSPRWLYDDRGCELFEMITALPEYYPTRTEAAILSAHAPAIAERTRADTLIELGSGTSAKTRLLLDAMAAGGRLRRFVAFDVAEPTLRDAAEAIVREYPGIEMHAIVGDFERHLDVLPKGGRRLIAFLGGTIGNLNPRQRSRFFAELHATLDPGDSLLIGTDLVKDRGRLIAAYDDGAGVTAAFNKNVLHVLNRELAADFCADRFAHVANYDDEHDYIEMRLRSLAHQTVTVAALHLRVTFEAGDDIRTEISTKFHLAGFRAELERAGFTNIARYLDGAGDFAVWVAER